MDAATRVLRLHVLFAVIVALFVCSTGSAAPFVDPRRGVVFHGYFDKLIFEMALSGKFGPLESEWTTVDYAPDGTEQERPARLRFERVTDFERCANAAPANPFGSMPTTGGVFALVGADELLMRGTCVIASPVATITAAYAFEYENNVTGKANIYERATGKLITRFDYDRVWQVFGVTRYVSEPDIPELWLLRNDTVTDDELVRALRSSEFARNSALQVLGRRLYIRNGFGGLSTLARLRQGTGGKVAEALIASGALSDRREKARARAWRAAATMPDAAAKFAPLLRRALETPVIDDETPEYQARALALSKTEGKRARQDEAFLRGNLARAGWDVSRWPTIKPPEQPVLQSMHVLSAAGVAASMFGQDIAIQTLNQMWPALAKRTLPDWIDDEGYYLVAAAAGSRGEELARLLIDEALRNEDRWPQYALRTVLSIKQPSRGLRDAVKPLCARQTDDWMVLKCDILRIRDGDAALFKKLQSQVSLHWQKRSHGQGVFPFESADALLIDLAPDGLPYLRAAAQSPNKIDAIAALSALCLLGQDAGADALKRVEALLAQDRSDKSLNDIAAGCRLRQKTEIAWAIGL